ncbi:hypothetical protein PRIPAC_83939 [Pristionchus pacificus]|uniref:Uncharacterized protein n=1 Tax=Pristionchus pacificus TaxID=54126 RepID=A0A2A6BNR8_PRIPA|nr:hypothetical protein PRIPAC_83939 [Pristionchus pacificus]|eukprot:PDM67549.1 hypothetical protein PRIPAC_48966 [Pristionchus pacificus]
MPPKRKSTSKQPEQSVKTSDKRAKTARDEGDEGSSGTTVHDSSVNLDSLPQVSMDLICSVLAARKMYEELQNLRVANRSCKRAIDFYLESKSNIPPIKTIRICDIIDVYRTSFKVELLLPKKSLVLHPRLYDLRFRIVSKLNEGEKFCATIPVRNGKDEVMNAIADALSNTVDEVRIERVRSEEELGRFNRVLGNAKVKFLRVTLDKNYYDEGAGLLSMARVHAVDHFQLCTRSTLWSLEDPESFISEIVKLTKSGMIQSLLWDGKVLNISDQNWNRIAASLNRTCEYDPDDSKLTWNPRADTIDEWNGRRDEAMWVYNRVGLASISAIMKFLTVLVLIALIVAVVQGGGRNKRFKVDGR